MEESTDYSVPYCFVDMIQCLILISSKAAHPQVPFTTDPTKSNHNSDNLFLRKLPQVHWSQGKHVVQWLVWPLKRSIQESASKHPGCPWMLK